MSQAEKKLPDNIYLIAAMAENRVIGKNNRLPWHMPADLDRFRMITAGKPFIMGRNSYLSEDVLLSDYKSIILSHEKISLKEHCRLASGLEEAFGLLYDEPEVFILGGGQIFRQTLSLANRIYLTLIHTHLDGDAFFPELDPGEWEEESSQFNRHDELNPYDYTFITFRRKR